MTSESLAQETVGRRADEVIEESDHPFATKQRAEQKASQSFLIISAMLFSAQFVVLCSFAAFLYHRFTLGVDFADYGQSINQIAHGNFDPYMTILHWPSIANNFELIMWPLALLYFVFRSLFFLSVAQVACLVLAGFVTWRWVAEMLATRRLSRRASMAIQCGALVLLLLDPTVYSSTALDFHFEAFATLFAVLSARSLWRGNTCNGVIWAAVTLTCGSLGGLYVVGVGLSALLSGRRKRAPGLALLVCGVVWIGLIGSLHDNHGSLINQYAYLAGRASLPAGFGAVFALINGIGGHPGRMADHLASARRIPQVIRYLSYGGFFGFFTPWGFGVPLLILATSALGQTTLFLGEAFQQRAVVPFVLFGTASLVATLFELADHESVRRRRFPLMFKSGATRLLQRGWVVAGAVVILAGSIAVGAQRIGPSFTANAVAGFIPAGEAAALRHILVRTPSGAEVIVSLPISGRFADHKYLYQYTAIPTATPIPVKARDVVLILDYAHTLQLASPAQDMAAIAYAESHLRARIIGAGPDVEAVEWHAQPHAPPVVLP